jgi:hypothetical protein
MEAAARDDDALRVRATLEPIQRETTAVLDHLKKSGLYA